MMIVIVAMLLLMVIMNWNEGDKDIDDVHSKDDDCYDDIDDYDN